MTRNIKQMTQYGGFIEREYEGEDGRTIYITSENRVFVPAPRNTPIEILQPLILATYLQDESRWTPNRTSKKYPHDTLLVTDIQSIDELVNA